MISQLTRSSISASEAELTHLVVREVVEEMVASKPQL